jgi:ketoreductase RED2
MAELSGKVAIVTGSSSGIGEAIARSLHALGASVVINSSSSVEAGQKIAASLGENAIYVQADISDKAAGQRLIDETLKQFGQLDILINNAGWTTLIAHHDLEALTDEIFQKTFDVNVTGTWMLTKAAMPHLKESDDGNVVSMTKAALNQMTVLLAKSCGPVRVNAVAPGLVETPWTKDWQNQHDAVKAVTPLHRSATMEDCVQATLGLLRTKYATGQIFVVDGGLTLVV